MIPSAPALLLLSLLHVLAADNPRHFRIGGVLSSTENEQTFNKTIQELNEQKEYVSRASTLYVSTIRMEENPIRTALNVCKYLVNSQVYAMVVSHPSTGDISPAAVSYTSGFYHIPVVGITSRDSAFSDKNIHGSFLRTVPPYSHQADVWVDLLKMLGYTQVIFMHSSDADGRSVSSRFLAQAQTMDSTDTDMKVEEVVEFEPGLKTFTEQLKLVRSLQSRVYLLYASQNDSEVIFHDAAFLNMTEVGYVWIVTEQALAASTVPKGVLGFRLSASDETKHIKDSLYVLAAALKEMSQKENITEAPKDCNNTGDGWETGKTLFKYIRKQVLFDGQTGKVAFDDNGDRINAEYDVINTDSTRTKRIVGKYAYSKSLERMELKLKTSDIIWPGGSNVKPDGVKIPTHLKVLTLQEQPFVYSRRLERGQKCDDAETRCPWHNTTGEDVEFCCWGYCIDLLNKLSERVNFTFDLFLSPDGEFGDYVSRNVSGKKEWTGMIGELVRERADMIAAPLTINPERAAFIEFSKPFKYQGITILEKRQPRASTLVSFLQPFKHTLWVLVLVSVHVVALVLYLLDRFSPFGRQASRDSGNAEDDALNLSSAMWFAYGVLLNSGIGDGTPRSFSARVLGMVWAGFAMIIIASYTANLAAFLVLDRPQTRLSGINDARLRNPMENFSYATVKGSAVDMYFRRQVELSNMYRTMEGKQFTSAEEAIKAVINGSLNAFIWDSSRLEFEAAQNCALVTAGELFGRSGYGIGLKKDSPWANHVTLAILQFHESGYMEQLDNRWIFQNRKECETREKAPATLGLKNMAGVFILVLAGIAGGCALIIIEIIYKRHKIRSQRKLALAKNAADRWRGAVEKRRRLRQSRQHARHNGEPGFSADPFGTDFSSAFSWSSPDVRQRVLQPPPPPARRKMTILDA
ncbi:glutamate [NMDA] receptor subunit 1-like isoform X1 [Amphibalanus amphitrite]|uniref:glutamate [NMDA] receptor subunit 1-like isoform X1 n=1 Tax=Amphibalanus amphitrite TaxID=1232801 RepID=UPI001C912616|nr:glutamate [NMDA] receptor subunit 1-like isoform X1 [Amphibalanus amphitrite]XP_043246508.1 glutamate [NMDA] receptor subunit 1-like isoform X1 [Amphibalanus amphitrite]XP_043246509.1 glutamate [NMDA] receptor subunit 1-like isoform X1 [Amphibalanus amphitrite]XP_043246511.1 glutamate [NMDA] receptor subunit 1-like isoform X1 [Amphibalanus amphitrite]XP_043246512.1 glutamate [NMDA] receptor subunit 1-like isoform X1 [Amphibalanus amphitrite]XP_043246513.1 glutamate [NMDA] receptor subunit 1